MRSVPGSASALIVANTYRKGEMNTRTILGTIAVARQARLGWICLILDFVEVGS